MNQHECSPVFLQFIDCVYQLTHLYSDAFEFTPTFLRHLIEQVYGCSFGTFLFNNENERRSYDLSTRTPSLWDYLNSEEFEDRTRFINSDYEENSSLFFGGKPLELCSKHELHVWDYYTRTKGADLSSRAVYNERIHQKQASLKKLLKGGKVVVNVDGKKTRNVSYETDEEKCTIFENYDPNSTDCNRLSDSFVEYLKQNNPVESANPQGWSEYLSSLYASVVQFVNYGGEVNENNS